jgi:hypothetical protein
MSGATYWQWGIPIAIMLSLAVFIASVFIAERSQERGARSITPRDRWLAGGIFRGDPRAVSSRDDVPGPEELRRGQQAAPETELPRTPAQRQAPESTGGGAPLPGPPRERGTARR